MRAERSKKLPPGGGFYPLRLPRAQRHSACERPPVRAATRTGGHARRLCAAGPFSPSTFRSSDPASKSHFPSVIHRLNAKPVCPSDGLRFSPFNQEAATHFRRLLSRLLKRDGK